VPRNSRKARPLVVGEETYRWSLGHQHQRLDDPRRYLDCREVLTLRRQGAPGRVLIAFEARPGRLVPDGYLPSGAVGTSGGGFVNLHQPGTVRALLGEALAHGWDPARPEALSLDGWLLFDAVAAHRAGRPD
jgi:hypothetical protein